jgi:hypothetical protein
MSIRLSLGASPLFTDSRTELLISVSELLTTGSLPPISLSWWQAPWHSRPVFFPQLNTCDHSPCVISSLTRGWVFHNFCWNSPAQSFSGKSPAGLMTTDVVSDSRLSQTGGPHPRIYIPQGVQFAASQERLSFLSKFSVSCLFCENWQ